MRKYITVDEAITAINTSAIENVADVNHNYAKGFRDAAKAVKDMASAGSDEDEEKLRQELWAIYAEKDPVKLPIMNDGYGRIPTCPVCGEMPYSTKQCYWCGQRFIQDEEVVEYGTPKTEDIQCPNCGTPGKAIVSKYNGHRHFHCSNCGFLVME